MTYDRGIQLEDQEINANKFDVKNEMLMGFDSQQENEVVRSRYKYLVQCYGCGCRSVKMWPSVHGACLIYLTTLSVL